MASIIPLPISKTNNRKERGTGTQSPEERTRVKAGVPTQGRFCPPPGESDNICGHFGVVQLGYRGVTRTGWTEARDGAKRLTV